MSYLYSQATSCRISRVGLAIIAALVLVSCGGGSSSEDNVEEFVRSSSALYSVAPNIQGCVAGALTDAEKTNALNVLNAIRALHGLAAVTYDSDADLEVQQISLMIAANAALNHAPPSTWKCYTEVGAEGASNSNLSGGVVSPNLSFQSTQQDIIGWLTDVNNLVADNVGHRRWLLNPFLTKIAYGRVAGYYDATGKTVTDGSAIKVIYDNRTTGSSASGYVAYPVGDYPARYFANGALLSFSVIADLTNMGRNRNVDFSAASVKVAPRGGAPLTLSKVSHDNIGYGLANNIQFLASIATNVIYDVEIMGVKLDGTTRDYQYWFRIVP